MNWTRYRLLRSAVAVDNPKLAAATYDSMPAKTAGRVDIEAEATILKIMAYGKGTDGGTVKINLFGGHGEAGTPQQPAILLATLTFTLGTMQCNNQPDQPGLPVYSSGYYFDTVAETAAGGVKDIIVGNDSGNDRIGIALLHLTGERWLYAEVDTLTNITEVNVIATFGNQAVAKD
jgi:hypothetical protein